ncbi:hypothetical protein IJG72_04495 [bacterium]|nr:hypothetical protein [bacterium]
MKKSLIFLFVTMLMTFSGAYAKDSVSNTVTTTSAEAQKNLADLRTQISSIQSKLNSISGSHRATLDNLIVNLLPESQVASYKNDIKDLSGESTLKSVVNFDVIDYSTNKLNKYLKTADAKTKLENLTTSQKTAIKRDLNNLSSVKTSYGQVFTQAKELANKIKNDPIAILILRDDLSNLLSSQKEVLNQSKNILKLSSNINKASVNAGVSLK